MRAKTLHGVLLATGGAYLAWSGIDPNGRFNWFMETVPAIVGFAVLIATYRRFPLTNTSYWVIWLFSLILMTGGHYTYAEVPLGNWLRDALQLERNHFDRLGHFFQGVVPALVAREMLLRTSPLRAGKWLFTLCVCVALAISAAYELFEWRYAVTFGGKQPDDFLGSQGDIWDAQHDMAMALLGAVTALLTLGRLQSRQLRAQVAAASSPAIPE